MIKIPKLIEGNEYLIIDKNGWYEPAIIKFKVIEKVKIKNKWRANVKFLKYINEHNEEQDVRYYNGENVIEELTNNDTERLFDVEDISDALEYFEKVQEEHDIEQRIFELEHHVPEHEYPDWDGDESIMYYLEHYREEDDDAEFGEFD